LISIINSWCSDGDTIYSRLSSADTEEDTTCVVDGNYDDEADDPVSSDGSIRDTDESIPNNDNFLQSTSVVYHLETISLDALYNSYLQSSRHLPEY